MGLLLAYGPNAKPTFTVAAAIGGTTEVGQTLTVGYTVTKARTVAVQWYSYTNTSGLGQTAIGTGATYVLTGNEFGRYIRAVVTASNNAGGAVSTSDYTAAVTNTAPPEPPAFTSAATISGTPEVGQELSVSYTVTGSNSDTIQWYSYTSAGRAGEVALGGLSGQTLTVTHDGLYIGVTVTATNTTGDTVSQSEVVGPVAPDATQAPVVVTPASISLDEGADGYNEGEYITCDCRVSGHTSTPTFAWYKCDAAKANPVLLTGAGLDAIQPLPVSDPNNYRGALFLAQSLGLNSGGKYVYCVASATNSEGTTTSESAAVGPIGAIQGTQITQAMVGNGPYVLPTANTTYYLAEDISANGTAIIANKAGQRLNLNGKTLTFDNAEPAGLANGGFETGDFTGWDMTNAPSASIYAVTDPLADWNNGRYVTGSYSCFFASSLHSSTPQYMEQTGITLERYKWYAFSAIIRAPTNSTVTLTLQVRKSGGTLWQNTYTQDSQWRGNRTLEVIFQAYHADPTYDFRLVMTGTAGAVGSAYIDDVQLTRTRTAGFSSPTINWRSNRVADAIEIATPGSGYVDGSYTGVQSSYSSGESLAVAGYPTLNVTVSGGAVTAVSLNTPGAASFFSNDTRVTVAASLLGGSGAGFEAGIVGHKIDVYQYGYAAIPNILTLDHTTRSNTGTTGRLIKNGTITQGQDNGTFASGISSGIGSRIHRVAVTVTGHNSFAMARQRDVSAGSYTTTDCAVTCLHGINTNRDYAFGTAVYSMPGTFARNTVLHSGGGGFYELIGSTCQVYGNTFRNRMRHTNQSSMNVQGTGTKVYDNIFDNTGDYYGRCMHLQKAGSLEIYNNIIRMQPSVWNAEYGGTYVEGDPAVQFEGGTAGGTFDFHDNLVECYAPNGRTTAGAAVLAGCLRWSSLTTTGTGTIRSNTLVASAEGTGYAWPWMTAASSAVTWDIRDNSVTTNSGYWSATNSMGIRCLRESVSLETVIANASRPFVIEYSGTAGVHINADLVDIAASPEDLATLSSQPTWSGVRFPLPYEIGRGGYRIKWTTTVATGLAGASVVIKDAGGVTVSSGTAESDGNYVAELQQCYISGSAPTDTSSYTVTVNGGTPVAFTADSTQTIVAPA